MDLALAALAASALLTTSAPMPTPVDGPTLQPSRFSASAAALPVLPVGALTLPPQDFEYSKAYYTRLTIHRYGSYVMLPLFLAQAYVGSQLYSGNGGDWAEDVHPMLAAGIGVLFTSNTITGAMNLKEGWKDPKDHRRKVTHAILMMTADAGFLTTAILGSEASDSGSGRSTHRAVAIGSMAVATTGWLLMTDLFRKD
jgi:hypothetical protein